MARYFLEVSYKGTNYSGFQIQHNTGKTIQAELEKAFLTLQRNRVTLTGSSRTDAGVHALQNFFHFDYENTIHTQFIYKMNAILPDDIVVKNLIPVKDNAHCRFDAISREYKYFIFRHKDPFLRDRAFYFPYKLDIEKLNKAAGIIKEYKDFTSFSKRNTQARTFISDILETGWLFENDCIVYHVIANRFLRGMVRALTGTMLKIGRGKMTLEEFRTVICAKDCTKANFSVPSDGLFLVSVNYPSDYF
jgi:tRNA pseudouridine38-40 synthase